MRLTKKEKVSYGLGAVGKDMVYMLSANYILYYYQDIMGVSAFAMGVILMAARIFDAFNDPIMGVVVAKTKTRWGKFRPWLLIGTVMNAIILYLMFMAPPALNGGGLVAYAAVFYVSFVMAIGGYAVLLALMFTNRTNIYILMIPGFFIFTAFGMLTVLTTVFLANTVDYGELKNNRRDESVIFSMQTFVVKLASGVAAMIASICLTISNISNDTSTEAAAMVSDSYTSVAVLRMTMTVLPIIGLLVAVFIFAKKYILTDEKLGEINQELAHRHKA